MKTNMSFEWNQLTPPKLIRLFSGYSFLVVFLLAFSYLSIFAQQNINTQTFFNKGLEELKDQTSTSPHSSIKSPLKFPWIEEYQLRTESRDFKLREQEYTFRISPSNFKKRKALKDLSKHLYQKPDFERQEIYCDGIADLYADWLGLYLIQENLQILANLNQILEDEQKVYEKMLGALEVDLNKLVKLQTDKSDIAIAVNELQLEEALIRKKYGLEEAQLNFADFVGIADIERRLQGDDLGVQVLADPERAYEKEFLERELEVEKGEKKQILDFVQFRYRGPHQDDFAEKMSMGLGLQFPKSSNQKLKMAELKLELEELELEEKRQQEEVEVETAENKEQLLMRLQSYQFYQKTTIEERASLQNLGTKIAQQQGFNPLLLLDIEERHLETQVKSLKKREAIFYDFLQYLEESNRMCGEEFVNYLVK